MWVLSTAVLPRAPQKSGVATTSVFSSKCYIAQAYAETSCISDILQPSTKLQCGFSLLMQNYKYQQLWLSIYKCSKYAQKRFPAGTRRHSHRVAPDGAVPGEKEPAAVRTVRTSQAPDLPSMMNSAITAAPCDGSHHPDEQPPCPGRQTMTCPQAGFLPAQGWIAAAAQTQARVIIDLEAPGSWGHYSSCPQSCPVVPSQCFLTLGIQSHHLKPPMVRLQTSWTHQ